MRTPFVVSLSNHERSNVGNRRVRFTAPKLIRAEVDGAVNSTLTLFEHSPNLRSMRIPTLGFEDDTQISKHDISRQQLQEAITLFVSNKFLCAITLAGAAEEVFRGLLNAKSEKSVTEESVDRIEELRQSTGLAVMENRSRKEIYGHWNRTRNDIKHHDGDDSDIVVINLFDEAYWMITRSLANASKLGISVRNKTDFEAWCIEHIH